MHSNVICVFLFLVKRMYMLIEKIPTDTAENSYPKLVCVETKEEMLSSGSSVEPHRGERVKVRRWVEKAP